MGANYSIVFFDGVCNLCNASVKFIINRDPSGKFRFASLQSDFAEKKLPKSIGNSENDPASIVLLENDEIYRRSTAALRIARSLRGGWPALYMFIVVPAFLRDGIYNWIAKNRYRWFGKKDECMIPTQEMKDRFLD